MRELNERAQRGRVGEGGGLSNVEQAAWWPDRGAGDGDPTTWLHLPDFRP